MDPTPATEAQLNGLKSKRFDLNEEGWLQWRRLPQEHRV